MTIHHLGTTYLVAGWIELVLVLAAAGLFAFLIVLWSFDPGHHTEWSELPPLILIALACIAYPIPSVIAGYGLRRQAPWSYRWAWLATVLHALNFPVGTVVAGFGAAVLLKPETKGLLVPAAGGIRARGHASEEPEDPNP